MQIAEVFDHVQMSVQVKVALDFLKAGFDILVAKIAKAAVALALINAETDQAVRLCFFVRYP